MSFINRIARRRIEAQRLGNVDAPKANGADGAPKAQPVGGTVPAGGRPAPVRKGPGLGAAMMRQTISDVFAAGEKVGLRGPLLARHLGSIERLGSELKQLDTALIKGTARMPPAKQAIVQNIPAQLIGEMSAGLEALDPAGAAKAMSAVFGMVSDLVRGDLPTGTQLRGILAVANAASQLASGEMGHAVASAAKLIDETGADGNALIAAARTVGSAMAAITGTGAVREELFSATFETALRATTSDKDPAKLATAANKAVGGVLNAGQLEIAVAKANEARALMAQLDKADAASTKQLEQATAVYEGKLAGDMAAKLGPVEDVRAQAAELLDVKGQAVWHHQMNSHSGQADHVVQSLGQLLLSYLAHVGRAAVDDNIVNQIAANFVALSAIEGVTPEHLAQIASDHAGTIDQVELPGTLKLLGDALKKMDPAARTRLLAAGEVEADGSNALTALANSLSGQTARYGSQQGPLGALVATLNGAGDDAALSLAARRAVRFAAEIPNTENGGIVERLRGHLPADMVALAKAGIDPSAVASAHPTIPGDSLPRLLAIGIAAKKDTGAWLTDLDKLFKGARGNKDHARNMRTLLSAAADAGTNAADLVAAFHKSGMSSQVLTRTIQAMLDETAYAPTKEYLDPIIKDLGKGVSVFGQIQERMQTKLVKALNLEGLLGDAKIKVTARGLEQVKGPLADFFKKGVGNAAVPQDILQGFLVAVLEDRVDGYRFTTPANDVHMAPLSERAKQEWMQPQVMMHTRFSDDGEAIFQDRVATSAKLGELLRGRMEESWGKLDDLVGQQAELAGKLRNVDKNDRKARAPLVRQIRGLPAKVAALEWATKVAGMTKDTITPEKFQALGDQLMGLRRVVGEPGAAVMDALMPTLSMSGISFSQVVTDDAPDFALHYQLATTKCLNWPGYGGEVLGYGADPNKRFVVTKNQAGEMRRAVMRIVERQDEGHVGEPMLILERTYPDKVTQEEKQRLMEHTIRRAAQMGIACGFATEYYWDATKTNRGAGGALVDMNDVLKDMSKRYDTGVDKKVLKVLNRASNFNCDYLDSAPPNGAAGAGQVSYRGHKEKTDKEFENEFIVMTPR